MVKPSEREPAPFAGQQPLNLDGMLSSACQAVAGWWDRRDRSLVSVAKLLVGLCLAVAITASAANAQSPPAKQPTTVVQSDTLDLAEATRSSDPVREDMVTAAVTPEAAQEREFINVSKASILVGSLTVFLLAVFVGFEIIAKVPPTLHTPLMSGSNAISGITVVGAILTAGSAIGGPGSLLGLLAVVLAMINVVGGFLVTHRMLMMFKKR